MTPHGPPDLLLLLYSDRSDPVSSILLDQPGRFGREVVALSLDQLVDEVMPGLHWRWSGRSIDPARTAVVNRLASSRPAAALSSYFSERQFWRWLHGELRRFAYVSSSPTPTALIGDYGSLLDQWLDLPELVDGLRVPVHRKPWGSEILHGDVHAVDPWHLYSLGTRTAAGVEPPAGHLRYVRPRGTLVHVAQVGGLLLFANVPPDMTARHQSYIVSFANAMATRARTRILEHAFFVGEDVPVFYSTCPVPVITGTLPDYPDLLVRGLQDDIDRRGTRAAPQAERQR